MQALSEVWKARADEGPGQRLASIVKPLNLQKLSPAHEPSFALIGFACDEGVKRNLGRPGAKEGPVAIRKALASMPSHPLQGASLFDCGDIVCDGNLEEAQSQLEEAAFSLLKHGYFPIILGGGHELAIAHYRALKRFWQQPFASVNIDAHLDMRPGRPSSGTSYRQMSEDADFNYTCIGFQPFGNSGALLDAAAAASVHLIPARQIHEKGPAFAASQIHHPRIHLSLCLDVFSAASAPGVSAPQVLGLEPWHVVAILEALTPRLISFDVAELNPSLDQDARTAKLAASCVLTVMQAKVGKS